MEGRMGEMHSIVWRLVACAVYMSEGGAGVQDLFLFQVQSIFPGLSMSPKYSIQPGPGHRLRRCGYYSF